MGAIPWWVAGALKQQRRQSRLKAEGSEWVEAWRRMPVEWVRGQTPESRLNRARRRRNGGVWVSWFWFSPEARDRAILVSIGDRNTQTVSKSESKTAFVSNGDQIWISVSTTEWTVHWVSWDWTFYWSLMETTFSTWSLNLKPKITNAFCGWRPNM